MVGLFTTPPLSGSSYCSIHSQPSCLGTQWKVNEHSGAAPSVLVLSLWLSGAWFPPICPACIGTLLWLLMGLLNSSWFYTFAEGPFPVRPFSQPRTPAPMPAQKRTNSVGDGCVPTKTVRSWNNRDVHCHLASCSARQSPGSKNRETHSQLQSVASNTSSARGVSVKAALGQITSVPV